MIPFLKRHRSGKELAYAREVLESEHWHGDGPFSRRCEGLLESFYPGSRVLLMPSATAALEAAALISGLAPGDEVIMPSFTFPSTANAVVLRGARPVFVDVDAGTQNLDPGHVEAAVTPRTRMLLPVHYGGVGCDMTALMAIAAAHDLWVVEDAAQALLASAGGLMLGTFGRLAALSFHDSKNTASGEGGALIVNDPSLAPVTEFVRDKGTDRRRFLRGEVDRYTWQGIGSSYLMSEFAAAILLAQLEDANVVVEKRRRWWNRYHRAFARLEAEGCCRRPAVPEGCTHNGHIYYLIVESQQARDAFIDHMGRAGIVTVFHFVPLHSSPFGRRVGRVAGSMANTDRAGTRLVRLPLWPDLTEEQVDAVITAAFGYFGQNPKAS